MPIRTKISNNTKLAFNKIFCPNLLWFLQLASYKKILKMINFNFNFIQNQVEKKKQNEVQSEIKIENQQQNNVINEPPIVTFIKEQTNQFNSNNNSNNNSLSNSPVSKQSSIEISDEEFSHFEQQVNDNLMDQQDIEQDCDLQILQQQQEIQEQQEKGLQLLESLKIEEFLQKPFMHKYKAQKIQMNGQKNRKRTASQNNITKGQVKKIKIKQPYLPAIQEDFKYTLVLDLDKTLIYSEQVVNTKKFDTYLTYFRPNLIKFLQQVSKYFEIVIFTAAEQDYADSIINHFDGETNFIKHRLYKQHMKCITKTKDEESYQIYFKDLSCLGRNLKKTILVDDLEQNFRKQPFNGILIPEWKNQDINDQTLLILSEYLIQLQQNDQDIDKNFSLKNQKIFTQTI